MSPSGTVILTGANGGLGAAIVGQILQSADLVDKYRFIYTVRNADTAVELKAKLQKAPKSHDYEIASVDLGVVASVKKFADAVNARVEAGEVPRVKALIMNAAYQEWSTLTMSDDGYDLTWQINHLANFILTLRLLQSLDTSSGRIMLLGSWSHDPRDARNKRGGMSSAFDGSLTLYHPPSELARGQYAAPGSSHPAHPGYARYGASKLHAIMFIEELHRRLAASPTLSKIRVMGLDPGGMGTQLTRRGPIRLNGFMTQVLVPIVTQGVKMTDGRNGWFRSTTKSAADVLRAVFGVSEEDGTKAFGEELWYFNGDDAFQPGVEVKEEDKRKEMWMQSLELAGMSEVAI